MKQFNLNIGGKPMSFETGRMAKQADGAIVGRYGDTVVLVAVCGARKAKDGTDFFPLTVDYQEKSYAGGKIPGGYFKREGKASEKETLTSRLMDRPIRPLFPEGFYNEVQVTATVLCSDKENNADIVAINAASAALMISGLPYMGPMAAARVGEVDGKFILNPTYLDMQTSALDIVVAITEQGIIMIEAGCDLVKEEKIVEALAFAEKELQPLLALQKEMKKTVAAPEIKYTLNLSSEDLMKKVTSLAAAKIDQINLNQKTKEGRDEALHLLCDEIVAQLVVKDGEITQKQVEYAFHEVEKEEVRKFIVDQNLRTDGRKHNETRAITAEVGVLPRTHGSALFTRGQTQSLGVITLGTSRDEQIIDAIEGDVFKSFMLHYNFPSYSVGEIKPNRGPGRREIGHGALAERSIRAILPSKEEFPYTIRVVSEILESNGSSSMASVCSGCLGLMDAGVPIKGMVAGVAMGMVKRKDKIAILTDIAGVEDHLGDMDFKVAGTRDGISAIQLDVKLKDSIDLATLKRALDQAHEGRLHILSKMTPALSAPRKELSAFAPRITTIKIDPEKIREIIGPVGKMIRKITADSGATIEVEDDGTVKIASTDGESAKRAMDMIGYITASAEVGKVYDGTVTRLMAFGAFVEILPGKEGLVHISELEEHRVESIESVLKVGDAIRVKVIEVDSQGRVNLSKKQANIDGPPVVSRRSENGKGPRQKKSWN